MLAVKYKKKNTAAYLTNLSCLLVYQQQIFDGIIYNGISQDKTKAPSGFRRRGMPSSF